MRRYLIVEYKDVFTIVSAKILLVPLKCDMIFGALSNSPLFQYCYTQQCWIFLYCFPYVCAFPTLQQQKLSLLFSLLNFLYRFCRLVYISLFMLLKPIAKRNGNHFAISSESKESDNCCYRSSWRSYNFRERAFKKRSKEQY